MFTLSARSLALVLSVAPRKKWAADDDWIGELHRDKLEREEVDGQHAMEEELRDLVSTNGWNHLYAVSEG